MNVWEQIREHLQTKVSAESYNNWLRGTSFLGMEGERSSFRRRIGRRGPGWNRNIADLVRAAIRELGLGSACSYE